MNLESKFTEQKQSVQEVVGGGGWGVRQRIVRDKTIVKRVSSIADMKKIFFGSRRFIWAHETTSVSVSLTFCCKYANEEQFYQ